MEADDNGKVNRDNSGVAMTDTFTRRVTDKCNSLI